MIELKNVNKIFNNNITEFKALSDINLKINEGEIFGIIGLSGAGKSTLIRCINFIEKPSSGEVIINGKNLSNLNENELRLERKKIGMIFQNFNLLKNKTVYENIAFPLKISHYKKNEINKRVDELLELIEMKDKKNYYPAQLSGGQKQRVAIARAISNNPNILLCDEATSALDPRTTSQILKLLKKINTELNITIVLITHEMEVIKQICDKVSFIKSSKIIKTSSVYDIFSSNDENISYFLNEDINIDLNKYNNLIQLTFIDNSSSNAIISKLSRKYNIDFNIIYGKIENISNKSIGKLIIELKTNNFENIKKDFEKNNVIVEDYVNGSFN